jgi:hypothetical protein
MPDMGSKPVKHATERIMGLESGTYSSTASSLTGDWTSGIDVSWDETSVDALSPPAARLLAQLLDVDEPSTDVGSRAWSRCRGWQLDDGF